MDVALFTYRDGVAEFSCDRLHRVDDLLRRTALGFGQLRASELASGEYCSSPRSEILRRERLSRDLPHVGVDVARPDRLPPAVVVHVLKQFVARQIAARFDDARETRVVKVDGVRNAAL